METSCGAGGEYEVSEPDLVAEQLLTAGWGTEEYPRHLLEVNANERHVLELATTGLALSKIARQEGLTLSVTSARYYSAVGKQEASAAFDKNVLDLTPLAQRVVVLTSLFGDKWDSVHSILMTSASDRIVKNSHELDKLMGDSWRRCPQLSIYSIDSLKERISRYDELLGPKWRTMPNLLTLSPDKVESKTILYDQWFGDAWHVRRGLLTNNPKTVIASLRALRSIGITQENTAPGPFFTALTSSVASKREKAAFIRRSILGHQQVYTGSLADIIEARKGQTAEEKELEAQEIEDLKQFLRQIGAKGLATSITSIQSWATQHGYATSPLDNKAD
jgi:hypothetical protein